MSMLGSSRERDSLECQSMEAKPLGLDSVPVLSFLTPASLE